MFKKTTIIVCAALAYSSAFTTEGTASDDIKAQIEDLKEQVALLKQTVEEKSSHTYDEITPVPDSEVIAPMNQGKLSNFLFSTLSEGAKPMGMLPGAQFPLGILKQRNLYNDYALVFSGYLQANAQYWHGSKITLNPKENKNEKDTYQSGKAIHISTASLYTAANIDRYVTGALVLSGNEKTAPIVKNAFIIFGNLDEYPVYATVGKNRIALGSFSGGGPWTGSLTSMLFRPGDNTNVSLAYYGHGLSTNVSVFQTSNNGKDFSYAAFYQNKIGDLNYGINGGYVYNIDGTGQKSFEPATKDGKRIGALNFDLSLNVDIFGFGSGFAQTTNKSTITNNALAGAWYLQSWVSPHILGKPTNFNLSYHGAYNTANMPLALTGSTVSGYKPTSTSVNKMVIASIARPFLTDNVLIGVEYAYMHMYNSQHTNAYTLNLSAYF